MKQLILIALTCALASTAAHAKGAERKVASVDPNGNPAKIKKMAIALAKTYSDINDKKIKWEATSLEKKGDKTVVTVTFSSESEEGGAWCPFTVTFSPDNGQNSPGGANIVAGYCAD